MKTRNTHKSLAAGCAPRVLAGMVCVLILLLSLVPALGYSQEDTTYEETSVTVNVLRIGSVELPALIRKDSVYLSLPDLFDYLKINNHPSASFDTLKGYFMDPLASFLILKKAHTVQYKGKTFQMDAGCLTGPEGSLYMRSDCFGAVFGLNCTFSFRSLSIVLSSSVELPLMREMRLAMMRSNMNQLRGEWKSDTVVNQRSPRFSAGMADWAATIKQQVRGLTEAALNVTIGARVAGGEATVALNYYNQDGFRERQQMYQWRHVNNDNAAIRQVVAGKFYSPSIATLYSPVVGVQVTNTPSIYRRSFGTYTLSNITEPNWMVELYVNDVLINYVKADASGFFTFEVPLVYGNSAVRLRFYGPYGEERMREGSVVIPFNFLPKNELNYSVSAGIVEDSIGSRFSRATLNYGLGRRITVGGGLEYLSSISTNNKIPFVNTALRIASNLMLSGEWAVGVRAKGMLTYRRPSNLQLEMNWIRYKEGQRAILNNYLEERNQLVSMPFRASSFAAFTRLTVAQKVFIGFKGLHTRYTSGEMLLSVSAARLSANITTYTLYNTPKDYLVYTNLGLNFRLPHQFNVMPQVQYEYRTKKISMVKGQVDKQFMRNGYLTMSYERNYYYGMDNIGVGMRFDFAFAQTYLGAGRSNHRTTFIQSARGSLLYDRKTSTLEATNRSSVGRGGVVMIPFLDLNGNNRRDEGEPRVAGLKVRAREGMVQYNPADSSIRILNLEPYVNAFISLDSNSFDNIAWRLRKTAYSIYVEANQFRLVEVPVAVVGEVSGTVFITEGGRRRGVGKLVVSIYNEASKLVQEVRTEGDGYFNYLGLPPGTYTIRLDEIQLSRMRLTGAHPLTFHISFSRDGEVADGLQLELQALPRRASQDDEEVEDNAVN